MSIFGPQTRRIDGEVFVMQAEFPDRNLAYTWQKEYQSHGYKSRIIPNASKKVYEVWVSDQPSQGPANNVQPQPVM